ncbi:MAG: DUF58 domain-containing protein [Oscillospiraceae bacterium]|nr:DUF58 domain-containing protein [Oscillospiraceae bacterium]
MKMKFAKIKPVLESFVNYAAAVALSVIFALYLSGRVGWFLVAAFVGAPVLSVLMTLIFVRRIYVSCDTDPLIMCKGDSFDLTVNITNGTFLPTPPVLVDMSDTPAVTAGNKLCTVSVMPFDTESVTISYKARISGPGEIGVKSVRVSDYFGLVSFDLKSADLDSLRFTASVIPDIPEVSFDDPAVSKAAELSAFSDDSEDSAESTGFSFGGFPGFENRDYIPGDPIRRINWKQSVKRGRLLVRKDDETACSSVSVILDSVFDKERAFFPAVAADGRYEGADMSELPFLMAQNAAEQTLGFVRAFILRNYSVSCFIMGKNGWECFPVSDENDMTAIRTELASYSFQSSGNRFPEEELKNQKGSVCLFCTPYFDEELESILSAVGGEGKGALQTVIYSAAESPRISSVKGGDAQ